MDIKPILGYDELRYMLMVGHEYVPEKRFLDKALYKLTEKFECTAFEQYLLKI